MKNNLTIRDAIPSDLDAVIALDQITTQEAKPDYWQRVFVHYVTGGRSYRLFLVAENRGAIIGFIVGEIRAWEFGSAPCGWVFALTVSQEARELSIGKRMFDEMSARMKASGVTIIRTMVDRDNKLTLSFFRGMGLRTGRYIELEKQLD